MPRIKDGLLTNRPRDIKSELDDTLEIAEEKFIGSLEVPSFPFKKDLEALIKLLPASLKQDQTPATAATPKPQPVAQRATFPYSLLDFQGGMENSFEFYPLFKDPETQGMEEEAPYPLTEEGNTWRVECGGLPTIDEGTGGDALAPISLPKPALLFSASLSADAPSSPATTLSANKPRRKRKRPPF